MNGSWGLTCTSCTHGIFVQFWCKLFSQHRNGTRIYYHCQCGKYVDRITNPNYESDKITSSRQCRIVISYDTRGNPDLFSFVDFLLVLHDRYQLPEKRWGRKVLRINLLSQNWCEMKLRLLWDLKIMPCVNRRVEVFYEQSLEAIYLYLPTACPRTKFIKTKFFSTVYI